MATAVSGLEPKETECSVCHGDFTEPKILPCGHLLCRGCLVRWLKADGNNHCLLCRCAIAAPGELSVQSCEELADSLPTDLAMAALVDSMRVLSKDHVCCVCNNVAAVGLCLQCGDMYCSACVGAHKKISATRHHKVESLSSLSPERLSASRPASCSTHSDRAPELYCPRHGISVCVVCATSDHRACPEVSKLEARVKEAHAALDELLAMLRDGEKKLQRAISRLDKDLQSIDSNTRAALVEIDATYNRLEKSLKAWRRRLRLLVKEADSKAKASVNGGKAVLMERHEQLTSHQRLTERAMQTSPPDSVGTMVADWRFHTNHGENIVLSQNRRTAERVEAFLCDGVVVSENPMVIDALYEVQLVGVYQILGSVFYMGVTSEDPASLDLPDGLDWMDSAHVILANGVRSYGKMVESSIGQLLRKLPDGICVGMLVDGAGCLHVYVDGQDQGVACSGVSMPCYALFDVYGRYEKIKALPVTHKN